MKSSEVKVSTSYKKKTKKKRSKIRKKNMSSSPEQEEHLAMFGEGTSPMGIHKQNDQWRKHAQ